MSDILNVNSIRKFPFLIQKPQHMESREVNMDFCQQSDRHEISSFCIHSASLVDCNKLFVFDYPDHFVSLKRQNSIDDGNDEKLCGSSIYSLTCRKCKKLFTTKQHRRRHEKEVCKIPIRNKKSKVFNIEHMLPCQCPFYKSNEDTNNALLGFSTLTKGYKETDYPVKQDEKIGERDDKEVNLYKVKIPIPKRIYSLSLSSYNKMMKRRFTNITSKKFALVGILSRIYPSSFKLTTQSLHKKYLRKSNENTEFSSNFLNTEYVCNQSDKICIRQYRTKCFIKGIGPLKENVEMIFYNFIESNIPKILKENQIYFIYANGLHRQKPGKNGILRIAGTDKTTWAIFNTDFFVICNHHDFGTSEYERGYIKKSLEDLKVHFLEEIRNLPQKISDLPAIKQDAHPVFVKVNDINIKYPFHPYKPQISFSSCVLNSCIDGSHAILQSPTGTGKTIALLCAALSWLSTLEPAKKPKIIYTSRTHTQLKHISEEIRKIDYDIVSVVIGSREKLCPIQTVNSNKYDSSEACATARKNGICTKIIRLTPWITKKTVDIEDFSNELCNICPFYASRGLAEFADVILMPFPYLIDPFVAKSVEQISPKNAVIIIDEAHHIIKTAEKASSFVIIYEELIDGKEESKGNVLKGVTNLLNFIDTIKFNKTYNSLNTLIKLLENIIRGYTDHDSYILQERSNILGFLKQPRSSFCKFWNQFIFYIFQMIPLLKSNLEDFTCRTCIEKWKL